MRRRFSAGGVLHIYQRTISGFNIFYSLEDFLVFYTIISVKAKIHKVCLMGLCFMVDHLHQLASADSLTQINDFVSESTSLYVREFNKRTGRKGPLFEQAFGSALKTEFKKIRSAIAYLFNNPVEKMLCTSAEQYRWNFLAYYNPCRRKHTSFRHLSRALKRAKNIVDSRYKENKHLKYATLELLFKGLNADEREVLINYIIERYLPFDIEKTRKYYRSYDDMVIAINSNTGSEYELTEYHYCKSDLPYRDIISCLQSHGIRDLHEVLTANEDIKKKLFALLRSKTSANSTQIRKFLHIACST